MSMTGFKHYEMDKTSARERHVGMYNIFFQSKNVSSPINEMITVQKSRFILLMHIAE